MRHPQTKRRLDFVKEAFETETFGGSISMALPPGATGSAVTGIQTSMVKETCKARFCGEVSNWNPCDFVLNSVSCRHPNEMKIQAPHGFARLLRTASLAGSLLTCAFLIVPSVLAGP